MHVLKGKVIWLTGASSGFGEALAYALAAEGARLILSARRLEALERVRTKIGDAARVLPIDLTCLETFSAKTEEAKTFFGTIDIIVHNGGIAQRSVAVETKLEVERRIFEVDFFSYVALTRCLLPYFMERKSGYVVVVSGALAKLHLPGRTAYCAAKAALHGYFGSLRNEVGSFGIDVTLLVPGAMQTHLVQHALTANGEAAGGTAMPPGAGCTTEEAARQAVMAIAERRFEAYVGKRDKTALMLVLARLFPSFVTRMLLRQAKAV